MSVCLSVTVTYTGIVETAKHITKLFSQSGSHTVQVFFTPNDMAYDMGAEYMGV